MQLLLSLWRILFRYTHQHLLARVFFAIVRSVILTPVIFCTRAYLRGSASAGAQARVRVRAGAHTRGVDLSRYRRVIVGLTIGVALVAGLGINLARPLTANAAGSSSLNFQARLESSDGAIANDGVYNVEFKLYQGGTSTGGGTLVWTEDHLVGSSTGIRVVNGYLTTSLGEITPFPSTIAWDQDAYVTMNIGGTGGSPTYDGEMNPRLKLTSVPYAFQAKQALTLQVSNGPNIATLGFVPPTANNAILLPDASGTVCLSNTAACGFALSSGSSSYIQNGTSLQGSANFNIQSKSATDVTGVLQAFTGQTADLLQLRNSSGTATGGINSSGNLYYQSGSFTGTLVQDPLTVGNATYRLPDTGGVSTYICLGTGNCAGTGGGITGAGTNNYVARFNSNNTINASSLLYDNGSFIGVNTTSNNGQLSVVSTNASQVGAYIQQADSSTVAGLVIRGGATPASGGDILQLQDSTGAVLAKFDSSGNLSTTGTLNVTGATTLSSTLGVSGNGTFSAGLSVLGSAGLTVGNPGTTTGSLYLATAANGFTTKLQSDILTADRKILIPDTAGVDTYLCLGTGNCAGSGGGITGSGSNNFVARFNSNNTINASSLLYDNGSFVGVGTTSNSALLSLVGLTASQSTLAAQGTASATAPVAVIKGGVTPTSTADLLQLQLSSGSVVASFDRDGNFTTVGSASVGNGISVAGGATVTGTTAINTTGSAATSIGTTAGDFSLLSTGLNVTTAGALSGITGYNQSSGNFLQSGSGSFTTGSGAVLLSGNTSVSGTATFNGNTSVTGTNTLTVGTGATTLGGTLTVAGVTTLNAGLTVSTGSTLINNSSTVFGAKAIADHPTGGDIGTAATTVDVATTFDVTQTTAGQALTLPTPTSGASGRIVYLNSLPGNASFTLYGVSVAPGYSASLIYNGTAWVPTTSGGINSIGTIDSQTKSPNGAVIAGSSLILQTADATNTGLVTASTQTLAGNKTLTGALTVSNTVDVNTSSATALQVRNGGSTVFVVDTAGSRVGIGGAAANSVLTVGANSTTAAGGVYFGTDTNLYRSATGTLKTDGNIVVGTDLSVSGATTLGGNLTLNGPQFTNTGATLNTAATLGNFATGGSVGSAASTVDTHTTLSIAQTTTGQTLSLPTPTSTAAGRLIYVLNNGSADFKMYGVPVYAGKSQNFIWNGSAWVAASIDTGGNGVAAIGSIDSQTKSANGAVIASNTLFLQSADASFPGLVSTGTQTLAGDKTLTGLTTLSGGVTITGVSNINTTGTAATNIGTTSGNFTLASTGLNVSVAGALSGISGYSQTSGNFSQTGSGTFGTGTGAVSLNGNTSITGTNTLTVGSGTVTLGSLGLGIVQSSASGVLSSGAVDRNSTTLLSGLLNVSNGGTGASSFTTNGILFGNGTNAIQVTATANDSILQTDASGVPSLSQTLPLSVQGNITKTGILTAGSIAPGFGVISTNNNITTTATISGNVVNATGTGSDIQLNGTSINTAGTLTNVAYLNQANIFTGTTNTFSGNVSVQGSGGLTIGVPGSTTGKLFLSNNTNTHVTSFQALSPAGQDQVITLPATNAVSGTDTICLLTLANCGSAGAILGSGTQNYITKFDTSGSHIGNSLLFDNGSFVGLNTTSNNGELSILSGSASQSGLFVQAAANATTAAAVIRGGATPATGGDILQLQDSSGAVVAAVDKTGVVTFKSLGAGLVQSSAGGVLSSGAVDRNSSTYFTTTLSVANGGTGATTFATNGLLYGNGTGALQAATAGTAGQLLFANATGVPTFATASGDIDSSTSTIGAFTVSKLQGNTLTLTTPTTGQYIRYNGSAFVNSALQAGDISGTLFSLAGSSGTTQNVTSGSTVSILKGASNNLTTVASPTNTITVDIVNNPTFSGAVTSTANTTALVLSGAPAASATSSLAQLGNAISGGNSSANGGTYLGINLPASGAGSAADFINLQSNGTSQYKITSTGSVTQAGNLTVSSGGITVTGNSSIAGNLTGLTGLTSSGTVTFSGLGAGIVQANASGVLSSSAVDRNSTTLLSGTLSVANGGTGATSFTSNGLLYGNAAGALQATAAGTSGQLLFADASGVPVFTTLGGDATVSVSGSLTVNKLQGNTLTLTTPSTGQYIRYNGTAYVNSAIQASDIPDLGGTYIKNGTAQQTTANFNIQARTGTVAATIQGAGSQDIIDFVTSGGTTAAKIDSGGNLIAAGGTFNGALTVGSGSTFTNASSTLLTSQTISNLATGGPIGANTATVDVATTFNVVQTTTGQNLSIPAPSNTTAGRIIYLSNVGTAAFTIGSVNLAPGSSVTYIWNGTSWIALTSGTSTAGVNTLGSLDSQPKSTDGAVIVGTTLYLQTADATNAGLIGTGSQTFAGAKTFNGAVSFAAAGTGLSVTNNATIGGTLTLSSLGAGIVTTNSSGVITSGTIDRNSTTYFTSSALNVGNGGTGLTTLTQNGLLFGNGSGNVGVTSAGTAGQLLFANASGVPTFASLSGDLTASTSTIGSTTVSKLQGNTLTLSSPSNGQVIKYSSGAFINAALTASDISGTLFTVHGSTGTDQNIVAGSTLNILAGSSGNLTTNGSNTNNLTVDIISNPSFTGKVTASSSAGVALDVSGAPTATATLSLFKLGNAISGGNSDAGTGGTYFGINAPNSGAGSTADFLNFQLAGTSKLKVTSAGALTTASTLTVQSGGIAVTGNSTIAGTLSSLTGLTSSGTIKLTGLSTAGVVHNAADGTLSTSAVVLGTDTTGTYVGALGAVDGVGSPNANGATISSNTLYLNSASGSFPGLVNTTTQTFGGAKTFSSTITGSANTTGLALSGTPLATGGATSILQLGNAISGGNTSANGGTYIGLNLPASGAGSAADFLNFQAGGTSVLKVSSTGGITGSGTVNLTGIGSGIVTDVSGSVTAGTLNRDTSPYLTGTLSVGNGGTGLTTAASNGVVYGNGTGALGVTTAGTAGQFLLANTSGTPQFFSLSGDISASATTAGATTVAKLQGKTLTIGATPTAGDLLLYNGSAFVNQALTGDAGVNGSGQVSVTKVQGTPFTFTSLTSGQFLKYNGTAFVNAGITASDVSGTLFNVAGTTGSEAIASGQTLSILPLPVGSGGTGNLTTVASPTRNLYIDILAAPTFTKVTATGSGGTALDVSATPTVSATSSLIKVGTAITGGNTDVGTGGTYIGINNSGSGAGSTADFVNFQNGGASKFKVSSSGAITAASGFAITGNSTIAGTLSSLTGLTSSGSITFSGLSTAGVVHNSAAGLLSTGAVQLGTETSGTYVGALGAIDGAGSSNANGATISSNTLYLNSASASFGGIINTSGQTFAGNKQFNGTITGAANTSGLILSGTPLATGGVTSLLRLGDPIVGGNTSANGGTYFGINLPSGAGSAADFLNFQNAGTSVLKVSSAGAVTATGAINFTGIGTGIVTDVSGSVTAGTLNRDTSPYLTGTLSVGNGGTGLTTVSSNGLVYGNGTGALGVTAAGTAGQFLFANTSGTPQFFSLSGDISASTTTVGATTVAKLQGKTLTIGATPTAGDLLLYDGSAFVNKALTGDASILGTGAITVTKVQNTPFTFTSLTSGQFLKYNGSAFVNAGITAGDVSGTLFNVAGTTGSEAIASGQTLSILPLPVGSGGTGNLTTVASPTRNLYVDILAAPTFTKVTATGSSGTAFDASLTPTVSASTSVIKIGTAIASGNTDAGTGGTYIGINNSGSGAGSTADFANFQTGGASKFKVAATGAVTAAGQLKVTSGGLDITGTSSFAGDVSITSTNKLTVGTGQVQFGSLTNGGNPGIVQASSTGVLSSSTLSRNSSLFSGTLTVANGGTNNTSFNAQGIVFANAAGDTLTSTTSANNAVLITSGTGAPSLQTTLPATVQGNITTVGALTAGSIGGTFGTINTTSSITTSTTLQGANVNATTGFQLSGAATTGHYLRGNAGGTAYVDSALLAGDISGTLFTLAGSTGTPQAISSGNTVSILAASGGSSDGNLTSTAGATGKVTLDITTTPTFSGKLTLSANTTSALLTGVPNTSTTTALLQFTTGSNTLTGASANGTYIGINQPSSGVGSTADFVNFQTGGTYKLKVTNSGLVDSASGFAVGGTSGIPKTCSSGQTLTSPIFTGGILTSASCSTGNALSPTLQDVYSNSGTTSPQIALTSANGGFKIGDDPVTPVTGDLFRVASAGSSPTTVYFGVSATAVAVREPLNVSAAYTQTGSGANTFTGNTQFTATSASAVTVPNGNVVVGNTAANKITLGSDGSLVQSYSSSSNSTGTLIGFQNSNGGAGSATVNGVSIAPTALANTNGGININNSINFANIAGAPLTGSKYYGLQFGTGYDDILRLGSSSLINGSGFVQNAAIDNTLTYTNLVKVGALTAGSIGGSFGAISLTGQNITTTAALQGNTLAIGNQPTYDRFTVSNIGSVVTKDSLTVGTSGQLTVSNTGVLSTSGTGSFTGSGSSQLVVSGTPTASNNSSLVQIGSAIVTGASAPNGTYLGLNGSGTADLVNFQNGGTSEFKVTAAGNTTVNGTLTVNNTGTSALSVTGVINTGTAFRVGGTAGTTGQFLRSDGTNGFVAASFAASDGAPFFIQRAPTSTANNTIQPTATGIVGLSIMGPTAGGTDHTLDIYNGGATPSIQSFYDANGLLNTSTVYANAVATLTATNANGITVRPGSSSTASGTGATLILEGGDQSGTTTAVGGAVNITGGDATGGSGSRTGGNVNIDAGTGATANGNVNIAGTNAAVLNLGRSAITTFNLGNFTSNGVVLIKTTTDSASAFQIQNNAGTSGYLFNVDSTNGNITSNQGVFTINGVSNPGGAAVSTINSGGSLASGNNYFYRVAAVNLAGNQSEAVPAMSSLGNPYIYTGNGANNNINTVTWTAVPNTVSYRVYRCFVTSTVFTCSSWFVNTIAAGTTTLVDNGTTYTWATSGTPNDYNKAGGMVMQGNGTTFNSASGGGVTLEASYLSTTSYTLRLPTVQGGVNTVLQNDGNGNLSWIGGAGCSSCIAQVPGTTAQNTVQPVAAGVVSLTVRGTSGTGTPNIFEVRNSTGGTLYSSFSSTGLLTQNAGLTVTSAGTFQNDRSSIFTSIAVSLASSTVLGTAAGTVDVSSSFNVTSSGVFTTSLPSPTVTTSGRVAYVSNVGATNSFSVTYGSAGTSTVVIAPGNTGTFYWSGTYWTSAGVDGSGANFIQNQSAADQSADFRITGTARANTAVRTPSVDSISGAFNVGTSNATSIAIGSSTSTISTFNAGSNGLQINSTALSLINTGTAAGRLINITQPASGNGDVLTIQAGAGATGTTNGGNLVLQGGARGTTGTVGGSVIVKATDTAITAAFIIQNSSGTALLNADTSSVFRLTIGNPTIYFTPTSNTGDLAVAGAAGIVGQVFLGNATGSASFDATNHELLLAGTARHTITVALAPEFPGAVMTPDGTSNVGTMTSDFCSNISAGLVYNATGNCATGEQHNYYNWTAAATNNYDIFTRWQVPSDFSAFNGTTAFNFSAWGAAAGDTVGVTIYNNGASCNTTATVAGTGAWTLNNINTLSCGTITAGSTILTVKIHLLVGTTNDNVRVGEIYFNYLSKF